MSRFKTVQQLFRLNRSQTDDSKLDLILQKLGAIMATLDDVLKDVTDESTQLDGIGTLISGLQQQVKDALANSGVSAADQAKIDAIFTQAESNKQKISDALAANAPAPAAIPTPTPDAPA